MSIDINKLILKVNTEDMDSSIDVIDLDIREGLIDPIICIDEMYNLAVCKDCRIGVPFEHVPVYLKESHGLKVSLEHVWMDLNLENDAMMIDEVKDWIKSIWVEKAVKHIPIIEGYKCN